MSHIHKHFCVFVCCLLVLSVENKVIQAKSLWETNGAVVMAVRRPG